MRLPIYRHLNQRLEILGLSPIELSVVCSLFILLTHVFSHIRFGTLFILVVCTGFALLLRLLYRRFHANYLEKFIRFVGLPDGLHRHCIRFGKENDDTSKAR